LIPTDPATTVSGHPSRVLGFLRGISGAKTVVGIHNDLKSGSPSTWTERLHAVTGKYPALWSGDFLFDERAEKRWAMIHEAERQWQSGAVVNLMWHACPPDREEPCAWEGGILSRLPDRAWRDLVKDGGALNLVWKARMDALVPYLAYLAERGVEVLWRPLHEMNQGKFWWGGRPGPDGSALLYRITFDYLTRVKGLANLIWTWDIQDLRFDWEEYHPGSDRFDVMALDMYGMGFTDKLYRTMLKVAGGKPIALGEVAEMPGPGILAEQSRYCFVMGWADLPFSVDSEEALKRLVNAPNVLTLDAMPGWGSQAA
jgi:mannan endo-1,4-beta-mannosidase